MGESFREEEQTYPIKDVERYRAREAISGVGKIEKQGRIKFYIGGS